MWDATKQQQLNELRQREQERTLTQEDESTLQHLLSELEQDEWTTLSPAFTRLRHEQTQLQEECGRLRLHNPILAALAQRQEELLERARGEVAGLLSEHEALKVEYERITGQPLLGPRT